MCTSVRGLASEAVVRSARTLALKGKAGPRRAGGSTTGLSSEIGRASCRESGHRVGRMGPRAGVAPFLDHALGQLPFFFFFLKTLRVSDCMELEWQAVVSLHTDAGIRK